MTISGLQEKFFLLETEQNVIRIVHQDFCSTDTESDYTNGKYFFFIVYFLTEIRFGFFNMD